MIWWWCNISSHVITYIMRWNIATLKQYIKCTVQSIFSPNSKFAAQILQFKFSPLNVLFCHKFSHERGRINFESFLDLTKISNSVTILGLTADGWNAFFSLTKLGTVLSLSLSLSLSPSVVHQCLIFQVQNFLQRPWKKEEKSLTFNL